MLISRKRRLLTFSVLVFFVASLQLPAQWTYPPSAGETAQPDKLLPAARDSLFKGDLNAAYKYLLLSEPIKDDKEWRELYVLTLTGLDKPVDAAAFILGQKNPSAEELERSGILLGREGFRRETPRFKTEGKPLAIPRDIAKKAVSMACGNGSVFVLTPDALYTYPESGAPPSFSTLTGGREVMTGGGGQPLTLTANSIISGTKTIQLPLSITGAVSFARAPNNCLYVLDSAGKVFLLDEAGRILEERQILIRKPSRIRTDALSRVFILSGAENDISVYSAGFSPLFVLSPDAVGVPAGRISDFNPDFAGNPMMLDKSGRELLFFNFSKAFLGRSSDKDFQADLFFWDGGRTLTALDRKKGTIARVAL